MINIFNSDRTNGPMSGKKDFYNESLTREEIIKDLKIRRKRLGELKGFDGTKILVPLTPAKVPFVSEDVNEDEHPQTVRIERSPTASMRARGLINLNICTR